MSSRKGTTIFIRPEHHQALKVLSLSLGRTVSDITESLIMEYLEKQKEFIKLEMKRIETSIDEIGQS